MKSLKDKVTELNKLVAAFKYEEAHDQFYHEQLVKHENENAPTVGLENHRNEMKQFLSDISNESAKLLNVSIVDNISLSEWHYQFDHKQWGKRDFREVSVQRWKEGRIIHERHLYKSENW